MTHNPLILIIEDDNTISNFMSTILKVNGYECLTASTGGEGLALSTSHVPELIILDLGLPDMDGMEVLASLRSWSTVPIIVVSARSMEREKVDALDKGADDYLTKPFGTGELLARIRAALRHSAPRQESQGTLFTVGKLVIDMEKHQVLRGDEKIHLTPIEFKIVALLARHAGKVLTYDFLLKNIWGPYVDDIQTLRVNMANIRRKLEINPADPLYIQTETGVGYRMVEEA